MATLTDITNALSDLLTHINNGFCAPKFEDEFVADNEGETWQQRRTGLLAALDAQVPLLTASRTQAACRALHAGTGDGYTEYYLALLLLQYGQAYHQSPIGIMGGSLHICRLAMDNLLQIPPNVLSNVTTARRPSHYEAMVNLLTIAPWYAQEKTASILLMCADWLPMCDFKME